MTESRIIRDMNRGFDLIFAAIEKRPEPQTWDAAEATMRIGNLCYWFIFEPEFRASIEKEKNGTCK